MRTSVPAGQSGARWPGRWSTPSSPITTYSDPSRPSAPDPAPLHGDRAREGRGHLGLVGDDQDGGSRGRPPARGSGSARGRGPRGSAGWSARRPAAGRDRSPRHRPGPAAVAGLPTSSPRSGPAWPARPTRSSSSAAGSASWRSAASIASRAKPMFWRRCRVGQQVAGRALQHRAHPTGPESRQEPLAHPRDLLIAQEDPAGAGTLDPAQQGEQGRLARAGGAQEGHPLAGLDDAGRHRAAPRRRGPRRCGRGAPPPRSAPPPRGGARGRRPRTPRSPGPPSSVVAARLPEHRGRRDLGNLPAVIVSTPQRSGDLPLQWKPGPSRRMHAGTGQDVCRGRPRAAGGARAGRRARARSRSGCSAPGSAAPTCTCSSGTTGRRRWSGRR